jgi:septum formation protein
MLILASASPRRADLLTSAGFSFEVVVADVDETPRPGEAPQAYALRVARAKAAAIAARCRESGNQVLAADTGGRRRRRDPGQARRCRGCRRMLKTLSGKVHDVHTAVVLRSPHGEAERGRDHPGTPFAPER